VDGARQFGEGARSTGLGGSPEFFQYLLARD